VGFDGLLMSLSLYERRGGCGGGLMMGRGLSWVDTRGLEVSLWGAGVGRDG